MFGRKDQRNLLKYLSKIKPTKLDKNVITTENKASTSTVKASCQQMIINEQKSKNTKFNRKIKRKHIEEVEEKEKNIDTEAVSLSKKKHKAIKNNKKVKNNEVSKAEIVKKPISEKKAAKIQRQNNDDQKLVLEVQKMFEIFKKEAENGTETVEDIENDILENEGFVEDESGEEKDNESTRSNDVGNKAKNKLATSMFRSMNEYLYTHSSGESKQNFTANKFKLYHDAYDRLMNDWPIKPVQYLIDVLTSKIPESKIASIIIADIGCGSRPQIAEAFPTSTVYSYDLYQNDITDCRIISADMCRLPLDSAICDYAVYSLSLMPTNLRDAIKETNRILKQNGHLLIVEVASRFSDFQNDKRVQNLPEKHAGQRFSNELKNFGFELIENEEIKPNGYFVFLNFKKINSVENIHKNKLPEISLKPCFYKPR